jgi:OOP family OmpA-OmpF porin
MKHSPFVPLAAALLAALCAGAVHAADPPVQPVVVRSVAYFGVDQARLRTRDEASILAEVAAMKDVTWQSVSAVGHTDSTGPVAHNRALSDQRAAAVKDYLVGKGLDPAMISITGKAAEAPKAPNGTPNGRAKNRRTEIEFQGVRSR